MLARLAGLRLRVRATAEGVLSGLHRSPHHGQSVEFSEHKEYAPGDELRHVDWKAWGKFDKYYVKRFEQETNLRAWLVVDASGSMGYRGAEGRLTKLGYACTLAGTLAHLMVRQQDAAGLAVFAGRVTNALTPRAEPSQVNAILETLEALTPGGETRIESAVEFLAERARRRSAVMVFSDLLDRDERMIRMVADLETPPARGDGLPPARPGRDRLSLRRPDPLPLHGGRPQRRGARARRAARISGTARQVDGRVAADLRRE